MTGASQSIQPRRLTPAGRQHFFGYFDRCPWDETGQFLLTLAVDDPAEPPKPGQQAALGMVGEVGNESVRYVAATEAWNYQQGCMQQWLSGDHAGLFIHNDRREGGFVSVVRDVEGKEIETFSRPVYHVAPDGRSALTLSFSRLARTRPGYGYAGVPDPTERDLAPANDGIWRLDLHDGRSELIVSLADLARFNPSRTMRGAEHWCNHLLFNPAGTRFAFVHRWGTPKRSGLAQSLARHRPRPGLARSLRRLGGAVYRRLSGRRFAGHVTRLMTANVDGTDLRCLADDGMASHFIWRDGDHLLAFARREPAGNRYWLLDDRTGSATVVGDGQLTEDGHCTYSPDGRYILTDTYPDESRHQTLVLFDVAAERRIDLGRFYSPPELSGEVRCDLHPRFDRAGSAVCFDSAHEGSRQMYMLELDR